MATGLIVFSTLVTLVLADFLIPKPPKTPEEKLGEALTAYLKSIKDDKKSG